MNFEHDILRWTRLKRMRMGPSKKEMQGRATSGTLWSPGGCSRKSWTQLEAPPTWALPWKCIHSWKGKETQQLRAVSSFSVLCPYFGIVPLKNEKPSDKVLIILSLLSRTALYYSLSSSHGHCCVPQVIFQVFFFSVYSIIHCSLYIIFMWMCI